MENRKIMVKIRKPKVGFLKINVVTILGIPRTKASRVK